MPEQIRIVVDIDSSLRKFLWLTVDQNPDGAVSVGMSDGEFTVPGITSEVEVDGVTHRNDLTFVGTRPDREFLNPHFTFHPPNRMHLRADNANYLAEQVVMMDLQLMQEAQIPWLTFVSKKVDALTAQGRPRRDIGNRQLVVRPASIDCSVRLSIDFIRAAVDKQEQPDALLDHVECWPSRNPQSEVPIWCLHLTAHQVPARNSATFTWHQST